MIYLNGTLSKTISLIKIILIYVSLFFLTQACDKKEGSFLTESSIEPMIVLISGNGSHRGVTAYDLDGNFIKVITDFRFTGGTPRSITHVSGDTFIVGQENPDQLEYVNLDGEVSDFFSSNYFSGGIYDAVRDSEGNVYSIESNNIEKIDASGARKPFVTGSAFIQGNADGCSLNVPTKLVLTENNHLIVAGYNSGNITTFDISGDTVTCLSQVNVGNQLYALHLHSNGSLYFGRWANDSIYRADPDGNNATIIWSSNTSIINNPTDIVELPNGNLLIAAYSSHTVEQLDQDGNRIGTIPFIADGQTLSVFDIVVTSGESN